MNQIVFNHHNCFTKLLVCVSLSYKRGSRHFCWYIDAHEVQYGWGHICQGSIVPCGHFKLCLSGQAEWHWRRDEYCQLVI